MKKVYYSYLLLAVAPACLTALLPILAVYTFDPPTWHAFWPLTFIPLFMTLTIAGFVAYWIPKYHSPISYNLGKDWVAVDRGVWWKMKHVVAYSRVMSVDVIQDPIPRLFRIGSVQVHTAGYTGPAGGALVPEQGVQKRRYWESQTFLRSGIRSSKW